MKCAECIFAYINSEDNKDIYSCPFDFKSYTYHSLEDCHHPKAYTQLLVKMRPRLNLYRHIHAAINEELTNN